MAKPIEVIVRPDKIEILSFPGPIPPVNAEILKSNRNIVARDYRNRRIGDFLKELHLTEGRGTGIPTIRNAMNHNGSPEPIFETDDQCTYFLTILPCHPKAIPSYIEVNEGINVIEVEGESGLINKELEKLYNLIKNNSGIKVPDIVLLSNKGKSTIERYLKILRDSNYIIYKGSLKTGGYFITQKK